MTLTPSTCPLCSTVLEECNVCLCCNCEVVASVQKGPQLLNILPQNSRSCMFCIKMSLPRFSNRLRRRSIIKCKVDNCLLSIGVQDTTTSLLGL